MSPGHRHRDNTIVAWARVGAKGELDDRELGVQRVEFFPDGHYRVTLDLTGPIGADFSLIPVVTPEVTRPPTTASDLRFAAVQSLGDGVFDVYLNSTTGPANTAFFFMVTAR